MPDDENDNNNNKFDKKKYENLKEIEIKRIRLASLKSYCYAKVELMRIEQKNL